MSGHPLYASDAWKAAFPGAIAATLTAREVANPVTSPALDDAKRELEQTLRVRWAGATRAGIRAHPVFSVYDGYYKRFGQNYHVQMQTESIALKGKSIPSRAALVEAMFMAELATGLLTAVHDLAAIRGPVRVEATTGRERYVRYDGTEETCKPGDMAMIDEIGVLTSIIQGPTTHALVTKATTAALFCVYAPSGIGEEAVREHVTVIDRFVRLISPDATIHDAVLVRS